MKRVCVAVACLVVVALGSVWYLIDVNQQAPDVDLIRLNEARFQLRSQVGEKPLVLILGNCT